MTAPILPRIAAELDLASGVFYAAESTLATQLDEHLVVWLPQPQFPAGAETMYRWAADDNHIETRHVTLDAIALAKLLYLADGEPLDLTDEDALVAIHRALTEVHCDMLRCSARVSDDFDAHPECAGPRWRRCEQRAARLVGTEA